MKKLLIALGFAVIGLLGTSIAGTFTGIAAAGICCVILVVAIAYNADEELYLEHGLQKPGYVSREEPDPEEEK